MKNRVKSVFFLSDKFISNFNVFNNLKITLITALACAHQVRKYAYRMKQNVFSRFHILI